jgi:hypothetical protein
MEHKAESQSKYRNVFREIGKVVRLQGRRTPNADLKKDKVRGKEDTEEEVNLAPPSWRGGSSMLSGRSLSRAAAATNVAVNP